MGRRITVFGLSLLLIFAFAGCQEPTTESETPLNGRVAFIANYREGHEHYGNYIVSMSVDGTSQVEMARWVFLLEGHSHLWSKNGTSIAYLEGEEIVSGVIQIAPSWLMVANADGSERRRLLDLKGIEVSSMSISPDGGIVLLECEARGVLSLPGQTPSDSIRPDPRVLAVPDLYAVDVFSGRLKRLTGDTDIIASYPVFSPNSRMIAFIGITIVWVERSENGAIVRFQDPSQTKQGIYLMNPDGTGLRKLTDYRPIGFLGRPDRTLQWSPDAKKILYSQTDELGYADLFTVDMVTGKTVNLTHSPSVHESDFSWSPDGKRILFTSGNVTSNPGLFTYGANIMDSDGTNMVKLGESLTQPSWSPDGKQIIAISSISTNVWTIVTLDLHGANVKTMIQTGDNKYQMFRYPIWLSR